MCSKVNNPKKKKNNMLNLDKWYRLIHFQGSNINSDVENTQVGTEREREGGMNWEIEIHVYRLPRVR